ncbi:MAG TPA: serine/threonine-protein kinase, partial [Gemmataceae bacterium]|nr:serine/threonine-protein kinase [Gemmataceae bacterium]
IHDVGEYQGQPYISMKFVEGGSLAQEAAEGMDGRRSARLLAAVADAVHYAHQRGILHRDLKPANVLLQLSGAGDAMPFITDFGLAKRLGTAGELTASGQAVGTPRYMAPEQAAGRKDLTVAADVYGLGVVLYERLTGAPPFGGDNALELYRQIREAEPPRPSATCPGLDRDLETVCLKCLEKEPAKRYASAEALADDLERWLRGEPILARPVGSLGRLRRWCRRNPAVAGLTGAVAVALLAGIVVSSVFAVQAHNRAEGERTAREKAEDATQAERAARQRAEDAEDGLEGALARSLVRPFQVNDPTVIVAGGGFLSEPELEALWELGGTTNERLRLRFLEEAMRTELGARQLRYRAGPVLQAAVGLDPRRREQAEDLLTEAMRDSGKSLRHRTEIALAALELAEPGSECQRGSVEVITQGFTAGYFHDDWCWSLLAATNLLVPRDAARLLMQALEKEKKDFGKSGELAESLVAVASRMEPAEAAETACLLTQALDKDTDANCCCLAECLKAVAGRAEPAEAARLLARALEKEKHPQSRYILAEGLVAVAEHLGRVEAVQVFAQALEKEKDPWVRSRLVKDLAVHQLEPADAARVLAQAIKEERFVQPACELTVDLASVAGQLDPAEAARVCGPIVRWLSQELLDSKTNNIFRSYLARTLAAVAGRLDPAETEHVCRAVAHALTQALEKEKEPQARSELAKGLAAVAGRLAPAEATRILSQALHKEVEAEARQELAQALAAVAGRLEPAEAARVRGAAARALTQALEKAQNPRIRLQLVQALTSVAGQLERADANRVGDAAARSLMQALEKEQNHSDPLELVQALTSVADRLEPAEAAHVRGAAARALTQALEKEQETSYYRLQLADGLAAVAGRLEAAGAARVCAGVARGEIDAFDRTPNEGSADCLSRIHCFLDNQEGLRVVQQVARWLVSRGDRSDLFGDSTESRSDILKRSLNDFSHPQVRRRALAIVSAIGTTTNGPLSSLPMLPAATEPLPCRLATQDLVELLKMPTCFGKVRRVILDQLGNRYGRRFVTHWDFVRYAQEQGLHLDFTTPPQRPGR